LINMNVTILWINTTGVTMSDKYEIPEDGYLYEFKFVLDGIDTENFLGILNRDKTRVLQELTSKQRSDKRLIEWYNEHLKYVDGLIKTITDGQRRIDNE
jgi:hypothetical protein